MTRDAAPSLAAACFALTLLAVPVSADPAWVELYDGPASLNDEGAAIALAPNGDLVVVGTTVEEVAGGTLEPRLMVLRYGPDGGLAWDRRIASPLPSFESVGGHAVVVDSAGRITAIGTVGPFRAVLVAQLDPDGQVRWTETFADTEALNITAEDVAVDPAGNVYATGGAYGGEGAEPAVTVRYTPDGVAGTPIRYGGPLDASAPRANGLTADGELVVAGGTAYEGLAGQFSVVLFDAAGEVAWEYQHGGVGSATFDLARDVAVAGTDVVATGHVNGNTAQNEDVWTVRLDRAGQVVWSHQYTTGPSGADVGSDVAADGAGNVFVGGSAEVALGDYDALILKYDKTGQLSWDRRYAGAAVGFETVRAIAPDGEGGVWAAGSVEIDLGVSAFFVVHYDAAGDRVAEELYLGPVGGDSDAFGLVVDAAGSVYATGRSRSLAGDRDATTLKISDGLFADGFESGDTSRWSSVLQ